MHHAAEPFLSGLVMALIYELIQRLVPITYFRHYNTILILSWRYDILMIFLPASQRPNFVKFGTVSFRNFANK